jgi:hypothetical protein
MESFSPIFRYGDPDTRNLSLVPATEGQEEADIQFYFHPFDGGERPNSVPLGFRIFPPTRHPTNFFWMRLSPGTVR